MAKIIALILLFIMAILVSCTGGDSDDDSSPGTGEIDDDFDDDANDDVNDDIDDDDDLDDDADDDLNDDLDDDSCEGVFYSDFLRYRQTMDEGYAYFLVKNIDWNDLIESYEGNACAESDSDEFALMLMEIHAMLRDSHSWVWAPDLPLERYPNRQPTGLCLQRIGQGIYVSKLTDEAIGAGMQLGDEVLSLDGEPVDDVLARAVQWEGCSSAHCCDFFRLPHVDRFSIGEDEVAYGIMRGAQSLQIVLSRSGSGGSLCKSEPLTRFLEDAAGSVLKYKGIGDDLGYMHLSTLSDSYSDQILTDLDQALSLFGSKPLIFDARYNSGGSDLVAMSVLARFLNQWIAPVDFRYKLGPAHDSFTPWLPEPVLPGSNPVSNRVVFLINGGCVSAGDFFAAAASYVPTFELMGTTTCGGTGAPKQDTLPESGIIYSYSQMQRRYALTGEQIEGIGIAPDVFVEQDPDDLVDGIDTQILQAIDLLRQ